MILPSPQCETQPKGTVPGSERFTSVSGFGGLDNIQFVMGSSGHMVT